MREKILKVIKEEWIQRIENHETVIGDLDDDGVQVKIPDSTKITLKNGDVIIYISNS